MTLLRTAFFAVFISALVFLSATNSGAYAKENVASGRYFIYSESGFVQRMFGARHTFPGGFTADLTRGELWTLDKIFGVSAMPLVPFYIQKDPPEEISIRQTAPFTPVNWGTKALYGDESLLKTNGGEGVTVAILDTGADKDHPDISRRIVECVDFTRSSVVVNTCQDEHGHGTHLAGIVSADAGEAGTGMWGVAPEASIAAYKVCSQEGVCWADDVASALNYAKDKGIQVVLFGFGGQNSSDLVERELMKSDSLAIAPAGGYPAASSAVVGVGSVDRLAAVMGDNAEFVSPGAEVESIWLKDEYKTLSGNSQAAAFIAGLAAKMWAGSANETLNTLGASSIDVNGQRMPVVP